MGLVPLMIDLSNQKIKVFGGGKVAEKRIESLINSDAHIHVISPTLTDKLTVMHEKNKIIWHKRNYRSQDLNDADFVVSATNQSSVHCDIVQNINKVQLVNLTHQSHEGNVIFPGTLKRGKLSISVSSEGASPKLVSKILKDLETQFPVDYETYIEFLYECRMKLKELALDEDKKKILLEKILTDEFRNENKQDEFLDWLSLQPEI